MSNYIYNYVRSEKEIKILKSKNRDYYRKEPLKVITVENGVVLPAKGNELPTWMGKGGVLNSKDEFVYISGIEGFSENEGQLVFGGKYDYSDEDYMDEEVFYMGAFQPHWGHLLLEYCTRFWYFLDKPIDLKIVYCGFHCEKNQGIKGNYLGLLSLLGIKEEQLIDIRKPTRFKRVIVAEQSFLRDKYITEEYNKLIANIRNKAIFGMKLKPYDIVNDIIFCA